MLRWLSAVLPLTWAFDALSRAVTDRTGGALVRDAAIVVGAALLALALRATTLRRRTPY